MIFLREPCLIDVKNNQQFQSKSNPITWLKYALFPARQIQEPDSTFPFLLFNFTVTLLFSFFMRALHSHLTEKYSLSHFVYQQIYNAHIYFFPLSRDFITGIIKQCTHPL